MQPVGVKVTIRGRGELLLHYRNIFCSKFREKTSCQTRAKGTSCPGIPLPSMFILVVTFENLIIEY